MSILPSSARIVSTRSYPPVFISTGTPIGRSSARSIAGRKCVGVTKFILCAPFLTRSSIDLRRRSIVTSTPTPSLLIAWFWQNMHLSVQPEKNTVPEPRVPLMHGSSHICSAALAITGFSPMPQKPRFVRLSTPHMRGHRQHFSILSPPLKLPYAMIISRPRGICRARGR